jgi:hypothetical protein
MIYKKGVLGQILTSFPSLIFVFLIMVLFIIISGIIGGGRVDRFNYEKEDIESKVLFSLFLGEKFNVNGEIVDFKKISELIYSSKLDEKKILLKIIRDKFHDYYSCNGVNILEIREYEVYSTKDLRTNFLIYPEREDSEKYLFEKKEAVPKEMRDFCKNGFVNKNGYGEIVFKDEYYDEELEYDICVRVEARAIC